MDDEDELQALLERAPATEDIRGKSCVICEEEATSWVPVDDYSLVLPDGYDGKMVPLCDDCKVDAQYEENRCETCDTGEWCPLHDGAVEWIERMIDVIYDDDDEDFDDE